MNCQLQNKQSNSLSNSNSSISEGQDNQQHQNILEQECQAIQKQQENPNQNIKENKLSKKQLKKLKQKQKWEEMKKIKRKEEKEKQKLKKLLKKQKQIVNDQKQEEKQAKNQMGEIVHKKKRKQQYQQKMLDGQKVVVDLQFYDLMTQKEQNSLGKQLAYCHSVNRKFKIPFNFIITSATQERIKYIDEKFNILNFGITVLDKDILQSFNPQKIVYLTGDAQEQLTQFSKEQVYVIGGIVDHNRLKKITINYANEKGIKARRLPMEGIRLKASVHLAVNHVWEWMLRYENGQTWKQAIQAVIPQRKLQEIEKIQNL